MKHKYSIYSLCKYFKINRSAFYKWCSSGRPLHRNFNQDIADLIEKIFNEHQKGYRYITNQLRRRFGLIINRKTTFRYMRILGLKSPIRKKRFECCTQREINEKARIVCANVLARNFEASRPLEKLVTDISYIYHHEGRLFISVIKDLYDNSIIAYKISKWNDNKLVNDTLDLVFNDKWDQKRICILHSDQGYQYTNIQYIKRLDDFGVTISHSRKANCYDNACCENFFSHLKSECLELHIPNNEIDLIKRVDEYIMWYNNNRPQDKLKGMTPIEYRSSYLKIA